MSREPRTPDLLTPVGELDHVQGLATALVTVVMYGDYQCPFTTIANQSFAQLRETYEDRLRTVYRHFPLTLKHRHAEQAAEAAEAAGAQGKFWPMHEYLFASQFNLDLPGIRKGADKLGLDGERLERELQQHVYQGRVQQDVTSGKESGVSGTPTIFINGWLYDDEEDFESLVAPIERVLAGSKPKSRSFFKR